MSVQHERAPSLSIWVINKYATTAEQGFETRTMALAREWIRSGHSVNLFASRSRRYPGDIDARERSARRSYGGVTVWVLPVIKYFRTASVKRVLSWLHFEWKLMRFAGSVKPAPDVIIVSSLSLFSVISGVLLSRRYRCPWVFEVRDIWPLTMSEDGGFSRWHPLYVVMGWLERFGYRSAKMVVGTMPNLAPHVSRVGGREVPCVCIPFGVDAHVSDGKDRTPNDHPPTVAEPKPKELVIGYAGSVGIANALDTLVRCARELKDDARFRFKILGDGDMRSKFQADTADCLRVEWHDRVPRNEVASFLASCDVLYFGMRRSVLWEYGMSLNKISDYMLAGKPIVGSYSGYPSMINEAQCGDFIPAEDTEALISTLERYAEKSPEELRTMGLKGRTWLLRERAWPDIAAQYLDAIARHCL
jgi:glycosyltransferase involved in cell wall biosynthesis